MEQELLEQEPALDIDGDDGDEPVEMLSGSRT